MDERFIHNNQKLRELRKELRNNSTPQEKKIWYYLKNKKFGYKFLRQHSIGPYIADFYCREKKIIIEIDGKYHEHTIEYDTIRTKYLEFFGFRVVRFLNDEIDNNLFKVLTEIQKILK